MGIIAFVDQIAIVVRASRKDTATGGSRVLVNGLTTRALISI